MRSTISSFFLAFLSFSFVQVMSQRDDVLALYFYCELAREENYEAMASKTAVLARTKGSSRFLFNKIRWIREICVQKHFRDFCAFRVTLFCAIGIRVIRVIRVHFCSLPDMV